MSNQFPDTDPAILKEATRQAKILSRGAVQIVPEGGLLKKLIKSLETGVPLKVKLGADPTAPDIHLGHTVPMQKLAQFQKLGHHVQMLIGDFTASIGDPSGRNKTRPPLTEEAIKHNAKTYAEQAFKILDKDKTEIMYNSKWSKNLTFADVIKLLSNVTVSQILQREDFANRYANNTPISMHELLYPIMQGYDSVAMESDIELGGTDQTFNCLMGREMQKVHGQPLQVVMTLPIIEGLDGVQKMSKSLGNYIGVSDSPNDMFGKVMSIPDDLMWRYYELLTDLDEEAITRFKARVASGENPKKIKENLAFTITTRFHSTKDAEKAQENFNTRFSKNEIPEDLEVKTIKTENGEIGLLSLMVELNFAASNGEARRLVQQNAVKMNGKPLTDPTANISSKTPFVLQAGKRKMAEVRLS